MVSLALDDRTFVNISSFYTGFVDHKLVTSTDPKGSCFSPLRGTFIIPYISNKL